MLVTSPQRVGTQHAHPTKTGSSRHKVLKRQACFSVESPENTRTVGRKSWEQLGLRSNRTLPADWCQKNGSVRLAEKMRLNVKEARFNGQF